MSFPSPVRVALGAASLSLTLAAGSQAQSVRQDANGAGRSADDPVKPVTPADYGQFERMGTATLSPDGRWLAVSISRVNEKNELRIHRTDVDSVVVIPYGSFASFSGDSRWVAYQIGMSEKARKALAVMNEALAKKEWQRAIALAGAPKALDTVVRIRLAYGGGLALRSLMRRTESAKTLMHVGEAAGRAITLATIQRSNASPASGIRGEVAVHFHDSAG